MVAKLHNLLYSYVTGNKISIAVTRYIIMSYSTYKHRSKQAKFIIDSTITIYKYFEIHSYFVDRFNDDLELSL